MKYGGEIRLNKYAVTIQTVQAETGKRSVQENEQDVNDTQKQVQEQKDREKNYDFQPPSSKEIEEGFCFPGSRSCCVAGCVTHLNVPLS
jgi:hypothetical protein